MCNFHRKQKLKRYKDIVSTVIYNLPQSPCTFVYYTCQRLEQSQHYIWCMMTLFSLILYLSLLNTRSKQYFWSSLSTDCWQHLISVVALCAVTADLQRGSFLFLILIWKKGPHFIRVTSLIWRHTSGLRRVTRLELIVVLFLWKKDLALSLLSSFPERLSEFCRIWFYA